MAYKRAHLGREIVTPGGKRGRVLQDCDCGDEGKTLPMLTVPTEHGKPIPPGAQLAHIREVSADHVEYEVIAEGPRVGTGPAQVSTDEYRSGWERTFASDKSRPN